MGVRAQRVAKGERPLSDSQRIANLESQVAQLSQTVSLLVQLQEDEGGGELGERDQSQLLDPADAEIYGVSAGGTD